MSGIAFLFPGQGSQQIGMGKDLQQQGSLFNQLVACGSDFVGTDLMHICMHGPEKTLLKATYLQPLLCAVSLGYLEQVLQRGITASYVLGHSLGEIIALAAAGVVSYEECVIMAARRGQLMDEMAAQCDGGMLAVLFVGRENVERLLQQINEPAKIVLANDNSPDQLVLSGDVATLNRFSEMVSEQHLGRTKMILVSGPWHSPYISRARDIFAQWVAPLAFRPPEVPLIMNAGGIMERDPQKIKATVTDQLVHPVFWRCCMERLHQTGVDTLLEIGPGRVLSGLARVNGFKKGTLLFNINNLRGLDRAAEHLIAAH
jgi:[acyl-carrier-protein] S-malonyltransferase